MRGYVSLSVHRLVSGYALLQRLLHLRYCRSLWSLEDEISDILGCKGGGQGTVGRTTVGRDSRWTVSPHCPGRGGGTFLVVIMSDRLEMSRWSLRVRRGSSSGVAIPSRVLRTTVGRHDVELSGFYG